MAFWGILIIIFGYLLRAFAIKALKNFFTSAVAIQPNHKLIDFGAYKYIRNPGDFGAILMWTGTGIMSNNYVLLSMFIVLNLSVYLYTINLEEKLLAETFGDVYLTYRKRSWRFIPLIY
jgi:protein-S-isoprenylcysteine O-methyltransferase Ste14